MNSYYPKYRGSSVHIDDVLKAVGAPYSRYGSLDQNIYLIGLAKAGRLRKVR